MKITLILGPQGSGKTTKAKQIAQGYNEPVFANWNMLEEDGNVSFIASKTTDLLIFDEAALSSEYVEKVKQIAALENLYIQQKAKPVANLCPGIIITSNTPGLEGKFLGVENVEIITMNL